MPSRTPGLLAAFVASVLTAGVARAQTPAPTPDLRYIALPVITFHSRNTEESLPVRLYRPDGSLDPASLRALSHFLRDPTAGLDAPIVPRTLRLIVRIAGHFHATRVNVVSAFRSRRNADGRFVRQEGYHGEGSAIDFTLPDAPMEDVAAYARGLAHVGVGWYPATRFVHLDSRGPSYFWENHAGPGRSGWDRPLDRGDAAARDAAWTASDDLPFERLGSEDTALDRHPRTAPDARLRRSASAHRRHRAPPASLHVFRGR